MSVSISCLIALLYIRRAYIIFIIIFLALLTLTSSTNAVRVLVLRVRGRSHRKCLSSKLKKYEQAVLLTLVSRLTSVSFSWMEDGLQHLSK